MMARLQANIDEAKPRLGFMLGQVKVPEDFDTMGAAEIEALFFG